MDHWDVEPAKSALPFPSDAEDSRWRLGDTRLGGRNSREKEGGGDDGGGEKKKRDGEDRQGTSTLRRHKKKDGLGRIKDSESWRRFLIGETKSETRDKWPAEAAQPERALPFHAHKTATVPQAPSLPPS
jgi:hypothetical protein